MRDITNLLRAARALQPITLPLAKELIAFSAMFLAFTMLVVILNLSSTPIYGSILILGVGFLLVAALMALRPGATYLALDSEGLTRCISFQKKIVRWSEVQIIRIGWLGYERANIRWNRQVLVSYRRDDKEDLCAVFPHMFGMNAEQLMNLLAPYYEHARNVRETPPAHLETQATSAAA